MVPLTTVKLRLIDDWHHCWKWSSMRFMALGAVAQGAVLSSDRMGLSAHVPDWVLSGLSSFALFCICAAGVGRITTNEPRDHDNERHEHV